MSYMFSSNDQILDDEKFTYYKSGNFSNVYKNGDLLLKRYKLDVRYFNYMPRKLFNLLKEMDITNIVKLYDYYYFYNDKISKMLPMDGYTMKYVDGKRVSLIESTKEYIEDMLKMLEETLKELSEKHVLIEDSHKGNIIFTENGVTIIDLDQFKHNRLLTKKYIYQSNKLQLVGAINDTLVHEKLKSGERGVISTIVPLYNSSLTSDVKGHMLKLEKRNKNNYIL